MSRLARCFGLIFLALGLAAPACANSHERTAAEVQEIHRRFRANPFDSAAFEAFKEVLPREGDLYVVEGDTLLIEEDIKPFFTSVPLQLKTGDAEGGLSTPVAADQAGPGLIVNVVNGKVDTLGTRQLTYAVDRASFDSDTKYQEVVAAMADAVRAWTDSCPECGISFTHRSERDQGSPVPDTALTFVVTAVKTENGYIAAAFYPNVDAFRRFLRLGPRYFRPDTDRAGVLRHEIGHVLGYRHEQIRGVPGCDLEDRNWKSLTNYDPHSVMHYLCGNGGDQVLQLTPTDKAGHKKLYGPQT